MGSVTTGAPSFGHRFVNYRGTCNLLHHFLGFLLVAVDTEGKFVFIEKELGCLGAVGVMATYLDWPITSFWFLWHRQHKSTPVLTSPKGGSSLMLVWQIKHAPVATGA
jgi:hypothetical protein